MIRMGALGAVVALHVLASPAIAEDKGLSARLNAAIEKLEHASALIEDYQAQITTLEERVTTLAAQGQTALPKEAVVAFSGVCPEDWKPYEPAAARFVIGAATKADLEAGPAAFRNGSNGKPLTERRAGVPGGSEKHTLPPGALPGHQHFTVVKQNYNRDLDAKSAISFNRDENEGDAKDYKLEGYNAQANIGVTSSSGDGEEFGSMPPYIALYFCKKKAG